MTTSGRRPRELLSWTILLALAVGCGAQAKRRAALRRKTGEMQAVIEQMTPRRFGGPVASEVRTPAELADWHARELALPVNRDFFAGMTHVLRAVGLLPANQDLAAAVTALAAADVNGFYDPGAKIFFTARSLEGEVLERFCVHELQHAMQDIRFGLWKYVGGDGGLSADVLQTRRMVAEGEARYVEILYQLARQRGARLKDVGLLGEDYFREVAATPYQGLPAPTDAGVNTLNRAVVRAARIADWSGALAIHVARQRGGWGGVDALFRDPPASSEPLLHPEQLERREEPRSVSLPDLGPVLGSGWQSLFTDTLGESWLQILLTEQLAPEEYHTGLSAAAGWGGDRLAVFRHAASERVVLAWHTVWDSERDAVEFEAVYRSAAARHPRPRGVTQVRRVADAVSVVEGAEPALAGPLAQALLEGAR